MRFPPLARPLGRPRGIGPGRRECLGEHVGTCWPPVGVLLETGKNDSLEALWDLLLGTFRWRSRGHVYMVGNHFHWRVTIEHESTGQEPVRKTTHCINVGATVNQSV